ncbi:MAG: spore coat protein [Oscillospiraceae bacterium]|jgi:spore coat protein CotF|nr:spore coat protein [Oscillospiraceae bacterium]
MAANNQWTPNNAQWNNSNNQQQWSDQDMIGDLLVQEKQIVSAYSQNLCEGSSTPIRQVFQSNLEQTTQDQFNVFQQMQQRGWYQTQPAQQQDMQQVMDKCTQHKNQML